MDKVKLIDAVSRGSHARNTVDPELIIGDASNGYDRGDILDANSVQEKVEDIQETIGGLDNVYAPKVENGYIENPDIDGVSGQILSLDSLGNTVWSNPTEGSVTDSTMSDISENPVQNKTIKAYVDSTIYDISVNHPTSGVDDGNTYTSLSEALAVIPQDKQKGGMTVRYIQSSDNKYVQFRLMADDWSTTVTDWQEENKNIHKLTQILRNHKIFITKNSNNIKVEFEQQGVDHYLYWDSGCYEYNKAKQQSKTFSIKNPPKFNYIVMDSISREFEVYEQSQEIPSNSILLCAFFYISNTAHLFWDSPNYIKYNELNTVGCLSYIYDGRDYQELKDDVQELKDDVQELKEGGPQNIYNFLKLVSRELHLTYDSTNKAIILTTTGSQNECFLYFDNLSYVRYSHYEDSIILSLNTTGLWLQHFIYFDLTDGTFKITTDESDLIDNALVESFVSSNGIIRFPLFLCQGINSRTNFPSNYFTLPSYSFLDNGDYKKLKDDVQELKEGGIAKQVSFNSIKIFERVGVIGDSYAEGYIELIPRQQTNNHNYSWPHYMEQLTGNIYSNFAVSGSTTKSWVTGSLGKLNEVQSDGNKCQAYIIGLMINDTYSLNVGVPSDMGTDNDTYYAWYYKLIQAVITVNPDAKIFLLTCPRFDTNSLWNQAVRDLAEYFKTTLGKNVFLIDLTQYKNNTYFTNPKFAADYIYGHYTAIGYEFMAECLFRIMSDFISEHTSDFMNVYQIPFDNE